MCASTYLSIFNRSIKSINQATQSINQLSHQPTNVSTSQRINQPINQPFNQPTITPCPFHIVPPHQHCANPSVVQVAFIPGPRGRRDLGPGYAGGSKQATASEARKGDGESTKKISALKEAVYTEVRMGLLPFLLAREGGGGMCD